MSSKAQRSSRGASTARAGDTNQTNDVLSLMSPMPRMDISRLVESNQRAMSLAVETQSQNLEHLAKIGGSVLDFAQRRLRHNAALAAALGGLRSPADAYAAYHDFVDTAIEEYAAELQALTALCVDQGREAMRGAEREFDEVVRPALQAAE
jgi:hypothetical protein